MAKCISCGAENPAGEKFCSECGMRLPAESSGGASMASAVGSGASSEQLAAYKTEAMAILKMGPANLISRRKLKMSQKRLGLTDAQAQDVEKEVLAGIERMKVEEQERAAEEKSRREAERRAAESDLDDEADEDNGEEDDALGDGEDDDEDATEDEGSADDDCSGDNDDGGENAGDYDSQSPQLLLTKSQSPGGRCSISLESSGNDKKAVARELSTLTSRTFEEAMNLVERAPIPLHLDIARDKAERIATALRKVGASVEIFDHDVGTQTKGNCSVVLQRLPSGLGRIDKVMIGTEVAKLLGCMPANGFKMIDDLPLTVAENVSREEADEIVATFKKRKCVVEIVGDDDDDDDEEGGNSSDGTNDDVDFDAIRDYIESFKESVGCNDIVLPDASSFDKKWTNLSTVLENSFDDLSLDQDDALAILDCTVFGSAKNGVLIDKTGIYTNNDDSNFSGWMDWNDFKANGIVEKIGSYDVKVYEEPDFYFGVNVSGCSLSQTDTIRFFRGLLELVRGEGGGTPVPQTKAKACSKCGSQLKPDAKFCSDCGASV